MMTWQMRLEGEYNLFHAGRLGIAYFNGPDLQHYTLLFHKMSKFTSQGE